MTAAEQLARFLDWLGFVDVVLPFLLVFTLVYGVLEKTKVLGKNSHVHALTAVMIALLVVGAANVLGVVSFLVHVIGVGVVIILGFAMVLGLFGIHYLPQSKTWHTAFFIIFLVVLVVVLQRIGLPRPALDIVVVAMIVLFVIIFWFIEQTPTTAAAATAPASGTSAATPSTSHRRPPQPQGRLSDEEPGTFGQEP